MKKLTIIVIDSENPTPMVFVRECTEWDVNIHEEPLDVTTIGSPFRSYLPADEGDFDLRWRKRPI
jgi:hypothetical protein